MSRAFPALSRTFTQAMVDRYGLVNEDRNLIHYDPVFAKQAGFPAPLVHGALVAALLNEACRAHFGATWLTTGRLKIAFVKPLFVGEPVTTGAEPIAGTEALAVTCRNAAGETVVAGEAACPRLHDPMAHSDWIP